MKSMLMEALVDASNQTQINQAKMRFQRFATPNEVKALQGPVLGLSRDVSRWIQRISQYCFWEKPEPEPFTRVSEDATWTLYHGIGDSTDRELIIGFSGLQGNLFQSSPIVLQHLDARKYDLLIVRDEERRGYGSKEPNSPEFTALIARAAELADDYRSLVTLGTSMGAPAALRAAGPLFARRGISIGGRGRRGTAPSSTVQYPATEFWCVFGADHHRDPTGARELQEEFPRARLVPIAEVATHNVSQFALSRGALSTFHALLLGDGTDLGSPDNEIAPIHLTSAYGPPPWALKRASLPTEQEPSHPVKRLLRVLRRLATGFKVLSAGSGRGTQHPARPVRSRNK